MRKIVQIVTGDNEVAGVQRHAAWLAQNSTFDHTLLISNSPVFEDFLKKENVRFHVFQNTIEALSLLRSLEPSCIHAHLGKALMIGSVYKRYFSHIPFIYTQHILYPRSVSKSGVNAYLRRNALQFGYDSLDMLVAVSKAVAHETIKRNETNRIQVILNGARIAWRDKPRTDLLDQKDQNRPLRVLGLSRMETEKRPGDFIAVAKALNDSRVAIKVYGAGQLLEFMREKAKSELKDCATVLEFAGYEPNIESIISESQLFLHFGREEACPLALIEVQRQGLPVITYGLGGNIELVPPDNGVLLPEGDFEGAARAIRSFSEDRSLLFRASEKCRSFSKNLTLEENTRQIDTLYHNLFSVYFCSP